MKTSNKILIGIISVIGLSLLSVLIFAKSSLIHYDGNSIIGNGKIVRMNHQIAEISFFRLNGAYEVHIKKGEPSLVIETDENIHSFLNPHDDNYTVIENKGEEKQTFKELRIGEFNDISFEPSNGIKVYLTTPSLQRINLGGTTKLIFDDKFSAENFSLDIYDFAEAKLNIDATNLKVDADGTSKVDIDGKIGNCNLKLGDFAEVSLNGINAKETYVTAGGNTTLNISGQSDKIDIKVYEFGEFNGKDFTSKEVKIDAKGNSKINLSAQDKLNVEAIGFAEVRYQGSPTITQKVSDNATLNPMED